MPTTEREGRLQRFKGALVHAGRIVRGIPGAVRVAARTRSGRSLPSLGLLLGLEPELFHGHLGEAVCRMKMRQSSDPAVNGVDQLLTGANVTDGMGTYYNMYRLLLSEHDALATAPHNLDLNLAVNGVDVSRVFIDSIAFGILWEQEVSEAEANVSAPFQYFSMDELLSAQSYAPVRESFEYLRSNTDAFEQGDIQTRTLADKTGIEPAVAGTILMSTAFGGYIEEAGYSTVQFPTETAERVRGQIQSNSPI